MVKRFKKDKKIGESAWEARILPLNYTRMNFYLFILSVFMRFVKVFEEFS